MVTSGMGQQLLRLAGFLTWALAGSPQLVGLLNGSDRVLDWRQIVWVFAFVIFGIAFSISSWSEVSEPKGRRHLLLLAIQSLSALIMMMTVCTGREGSLLVITAAQAGWLLPLRSAAIWASSQFLLMGGALSMVMPLSVVLRLMGLYMGFQALALFSFHFGASQFRARQELARVNAELRATQELLADASRIAERERISRELHDALGHDLSALSINLEVASHLSDGRALPHIQTAQSLTKHILEDVRSAVSSLRNDRPIDIARAARILVAAVPSPRIHLHLPDDLKMTDPVRAHTLLRCMQEIITNTVKHARAENLWIELVEVAEGVEVHAKDDGRGAAQIRPGLGLTGMRERLELIGGRLEIESRQKMGFTLNAWIPSGRSQP